MAARLFSLTSLVLVFLTYMSLNLQSGTCLALAASTEDSRPPTTLEEAQVQTQRIWSELRETNPSWKDPTIDTKSRTLPATLWHYAKIVFRALFMNSPTRHVDNDTARLSPALQTAVEGLKQASELDNDALFLLAEMNFYGNFSHPRVPRAAYEYYRDLAEIDGNATAQHMLGLIYATGLGGAVELDQSKAHLYYTFAAEQGNIRAQMTLAHRYHAGIATPKSCDRAVEYYKRVADKAMDWWQSGPPGGHLIQRNSARWVEDVGGAYGEGASWSSAGAHASDKNAVYASFDNVLEFYDMKERQGDWGATLLLGRHFYEPPRGYRRNLIKARKQFAKITSAYWTRDGKISTKAPKGIEATAAKAAAYIGRMYLRGEGTEQNFERALTWFNRAKANGDAFALYHLGIVYRDGLGVPADATRAAGYFKVAAEQQLGIAMSALGVLFLDQGDIETATRYFERARNANVMEGYYYLAELANSGIGMHKNCGLAATFYKIVAEKAELLHSAFIEANSAFERGDMERAFIASLLAAEQGYENAQANVAYLLDEKTSVLRLPEFIPLFSTPLEPVSPAARTALLTNPLLAQVYFTRSAQQNNIDSLIKAGDYHGKGISSPLMLAQSQKNSSQSSLSAMYTCYSHASETSNSAQALWKMGWMHENGLGDDANPIVKQDFHMAKRYYDLAYEMNKEAYLPVKLALLKLRLRSWWNGVSGGKVKGIEGESDEDQKKNKRPKSFMEWLNRFIDAAYEMDEEEYAALERERAIERNGGVAPREEDGLEAIAYGEPAGVGERAADDGNWYTGVPREGEDDYYSDFDDGLLESLIIVALAGALAMLVYLRQQRQRDGQRNGGAGGNVIIPLPGNAGNDQGQAQAQQQQQEQADVQGQNGGFFPNPGDPEYQNWVAGGIGH